MTKYKLKTHKGAQKRISISGSGRLLRAKGMQSHLRRKKPQAVRRLYEEMLPVHQADTRRLRRLLPYGV
ncbi:MAG: 50S ribosomal protein L35 [Chloroflexi bacterium]|nr:50S ribosomal protein L35 [Chloroflexota bacterium]